MASLVAEGQPVNAAMQNERVWRNRQGPVSSALNRHSLEELQALLDRASVIDQSVKGLNKHNTWDELSQLLLALGAGHNSVESLSA